MPSLHITPSGGLLTHQFIEAVQQPSFIHPAAAPETFALPGKDAPAPAELDRAIAAAWEMLVERWDAIENDLPKMDLSTLRDRWVRPLFQLLEFDLEYQRADLVLEDDLRFPISYIGNPIRAVDVRVPIHSVLPTPAGLDARRDGAGSGMRRLSPHDLLQRYLNMAPDARWGLLTDGIHLRLLRDYHHTYTRGYVEFDLAGIFAGRDFAAFRALYRLCHSSRFLGTAALSAEKKKKPKAVSEEEEQVEEEAPQALTPLESFYQHALATGVKVGEDLRDNVREAIETLANGFLQATPGLVARIGEDAAAAAKLYEDILYTIYRVLFLLFAEQRGMFPGRGSLYMDEYSLTALRARAERPAGEDPHFDLWERLKATFRIVEHGAPELRVFAYNGALFSAARTPILTPKNPAEDGKDAPIIRNDALLRAVRALTTVERERVLQRISYADLSVEEMGSVYESLLDYTPRISRVEEQVDGRTVKPGQFYLDPRGKTRKTTGSYYTHPTLVNELIRSALLPVLEERLKEAMPGYDPERPDLLKPEQREAAEAALLDLKVVDPAAGSGAFLIAADNALGLRLAQIRAGDLYPPEREIRRAKRDVLARCIYAVDLNPMAVELCKVSLWINAAVEDAPLNFLDHHIKCGNSLVGIGPGQPVRLRGERLLDLTGMEIHPDAFNPLSMDEPPIARAVKKRHQDELEQRRRNARQPGIFAVAAVYGPDDAHYAEITGLSLDDPHEAERHFRAWSQDDLYLRSRFAADVWTAAHFWPHTKEISQRCPAPTEAVFRQACLEGPKSLPQAFAQEVESLRRQHRFFHWPLEFPEVFGEGKRGGFDVVLGNPPWERIKLQEQEFFSARDEAIANAPNAAARKRMIAALPKTNPALWSDYRTELRKSEALSRYLRACGRYPLGATGDINTYQVFAEHDRDLIGHSGQAGIIVPTGIATDYSNKDFFADLVETGRLVSLYDFENRRGIFPGVHRSYKFCLLTLRNSCPSPDRRGEVDEISAADFAFFLLSVDDPHDPERHFTLSAADFDLLNPNTRTCPVFRSRTDAELTRKLYQAAPILVKENTLSQVGKIQVSEESFWGVKFLAMFHMANDSGLFRSAYNHETFPLYEAKMFWQYDHRFGTYEGVSDRSSTHLPNPSLQQHTDPQYLVCAWYWVHRKDVELRLGNWQRRWMVLYRRITNSTNERTIIATITPLAGAGDPAMVLLFSNKKTYEVACLLGMLNSIVFDYCARQKIGGTDLRNHFFKQLPVIPPEKIYSWVFSGIRVLELVFTSWDLLPFADDFWKDASNELRKATKNQWERNALITDGGHRDAQFPDWLVKIDPKGFPYPPFKWDEERRAQLRAELDGFYAHLYGLHRDEFAYILDTFPIVRRKDEAKYGEYRTKRLCLEAYDRIAASPEFEELIPAEARERSKYSVLGGRAVIPSIQPAPRPAPVDPSSSQPKRAPAAAPPASPRLKQDPEPVPEPAPQPTLLPSDFGLYKCLGCGKLVVGYDKENHVREKHRGQDPGWKKMGG